MSMELSQSEALLDHVMHEPLVRQMQDELTTYNASIIENSDITEEEVGYIIDDLNEKYMPMLSNGAVVSGYMEFPKPGSLDPQTGEFETEYRYFDEQVIEVYGFVQTKEDIALSDDDVLSHPVIALNVGRNADPHEREMEKQVIGMYTGIVRPERVDIAPFTMSKERARAWLEYHYADALVDLETRILNATNEADGLLRLAGFSVDLQADLLDRSRQAFNVYLEDMLVFDDKVPYLAIMEGTVWTPSGDEHALSYISKGQYLTYFRHLFMVPDDLNDSLTHIPMVEVSVIHPEYDGKDHQFISDVANLENAYSIRQTYYAT